MSLSYTDFQTFENNLPQNDETYLLTPRSVERGGQSNIS